MTLRPPQVVGGMTWCITTCNFDIDVDLLFQENSTIGQKMQVLSNFCCDLPKVKTLKIVSVPSGFTPNGLPSYWL